MIYLTGLGIKEGDLSVRGRELILSGKTVIVKTALTESYKSVSGLNVKHRTLDEIYQKSRNFDTLNKNIADEVIKEARLSDVVFCVDGSPECDNSAKLIAKKYKDTIFIGAPSKHAYIAALANLEGGYTCFSAYEKDFKPTLPLVVYDIDSEYTAAQLKLKLAKELGDEADVIFIRGEDRHNIKLYELDRQGGYDYSCAIAVKNLNFTEKQRYNYDDLIYIIERLRGEGGCPWDRAQTHETLKINLIEEAYELVEAIEQADDFKLEEETGDVLLQAAFHSVLADERGVFDAADVLTAVCKKLIFRHTHIFGGDKAASEEEALKVWDKNKKLEKGHLTYGQALADVPKNFPSCLYAEKLQKRAAKSGFDFADWQQALKKVYEETEELKAAADSGNKAEIDEEGGDLLFAVINVLRLLKTDGESALRESSLKFLKRFIKTEELILADGKNMDDMTLEEMDGYYNAAKRA